jgi:hypothetical protein
MPEDLERLGERLQDGRPLPRAAFRGDLRRRLMARGPGRPRPDRLGARIAAYAGAGAFLLAIAAISAAGAGPLGA